MARSAIKVDGMKQVRGSFARVARASEGALADGVEAGAAHLAREIGEEARVDTGRARDSFIHVPERRKSPRRASELIGANRSAFYIGFFEIGTKYLAEDPFMEPTMQRERHTVRDLVSEAYALGILQRI